MPRCTVLTEICLHSEWVISQKLRKFDLPLKLHHLELTVQWMTVMEYSYSMLIYFISNRLPHAVL